MSIIVGIGIFLLVCALFGACCAGKCEEAEGATAGAVAGGMAGLGCLMSCLWMAFCFFCLIMFIGFIKSLFS